MRSETTASATSDIDRIVASVPGWTPPDQLLALYMLAITTAPLGGDILEIGSWCGRSTAVLGHAVRRSGGGHVWAVDLFPDAHDWIQNADGSYSMRGAIGDQAFAAYVDQTVWEEPFRRDIEPVYARSPKLIDVFRSTMQGEGVEGVVTAFRGTSQQWAESRVAPSKLRLAFVDGDHSYDAVCADIAVVERFLAPGGWIAFDDAFSYYDGVNRAVTERIIQSSNYELAHQLSRKFFVAQRAGSPRG